MTNKNKDKITTTEITIDDLKKCGVHIPIFKAKNVTFNESNKTEIFKTYKAVIPFSLDLIEIFNFIPISLFWKDKDQVYTDAIINLNFDDAYYEQKDEKRNTYNSKKKKVITYSKSRGNINESQSDMRTNLYINGFNIYDDKGNVKQEYVQYKRSSAKSKIGDCWFILKDYYDHMIDWSRLGVKFKETNSIDLAAEKAYESLPTSSLIDTIKISPKHILIIDDVPATVTFPASVTKLDKNHMPITETIENYPCTHDLWDGQGLISSNIIPDHLKDHTMVLLRERWLKCAAFSTQLQSSIDEDGNKIKGFFETKCEAEGRDYETATTINMFGDTIDLKSVELCITPNSLKLLKFAEFVDDPDYIPNPVLDNEMNTKRKAFNYWINHITGTLGVCKQEHESKFGTHQKLTYQFINSLDINKEQLTELLKSEFDYIDMLKNDDIVFKNHISNMYVSDNKSFIMNMFAVNDEAIKTVMFKNQRPSKSQILKDCRHTVIDHYIKSLKKGGIKVDNADYMTLFSSPYEMLCAAYGDTITDTLIQRDTDIEDGAVEVYNNRFDDGQYTCGWRNPMINQGNVCYCLNRNHDEYKWFNLSENIIIIDGWSNFVERNQGADEDSDTFCQCGIVTLVEVAKQMVQSGNYPVPINGISNSFKKTPRNFTALESADIDNIIANSNSDIGIVCNWATVLNSKYFDLKSKGAKQSLLDDIYKKSSMCSTFSQLSIDRSKKNFSNKDCNISECLKTIYDLVNDEGNSIFEKIEIPVRKKNLDDDEVIFVNVQLERLKSKEIDEVQFNDILDKKLIDHKTYKKSGDIKEMWISKPIRPMFFMYLDTGDKRQAKDITKSNWNCPMNYLEEILKNLDPKSTENTIPLSKIIKPVDLKKVDYRQINKIFQLYYDYDKKCNQLWIINKKDYKNNKLTEKQYYNDLIEDVKKIKISVDSIMQILCICYDPKYTKLKKSKTFPVTNKAGERIRVSYTSQAMDTCGVLWESHSDEFKKAFQYQKGKSTILKLSDNEDFDKIIWGVKYKKEAV